MTPDRQTPAAANDRRRERLPDGQAHEPRGRAPDRPRGPLPTRVEDLPELPAVYADVLDTGLAALDLQLSDTARSIVDGHVRLLLSWTAAINLTAIREPADVARLHVLDSLTAVPLLAALGVSRFIDLGSGGGFPGLPLAAALDAERVLLIDSVAKKVRFLRTVIEATGLDRQVAAEPDRAETVAHDARTARPGRPSLRVPWRRSPSSWSWRFRSSRRAACWSRGSANRSRPSSRRRMVPYGRFAQGRSGSSPAMHPASPPTAWSWSRAPGPSSPAFRAIRRSVVDGRCEQRGRLTLTLVAALPSSAMRVAVLSDIHSNLVALDTVLSEMPSVDEVWHLGDVVGYGPEPDGVVTRLREIDAIGVRGNHDAAALGGREIESFNVDARRAAEWTRATISEATKAWLAALPARDARARGLPAGPREPARSDLGVHHLDTRRPCKHGRHADPLRPPRPHAPAGRLHRGRWTPRDHESGLGLGAQLRRAARPAQPRQRWPAPRTGSRAPAGCCSTPTPGPPPGGAPRTTSGASRRPWSGPLPERLVARLAYGL